MKQSIPFGVNPAGGRIGFRREFGEIGAPDIVAGPGMMVKNLGGGKVALEARRTRRGSGGVAVIPPLTVQAASEGTVIVTWGTVTAASGAVLTPTIGGDALDLLPAPELAIGGNGSVYLKVTTNVLGVATLAEVVYSGTTLSNSATIGYVLLAQISGYAAGPPVAFAIAVNTSGSQAHQRCGATTHLFGRL